MISINATLLFQVVNFLLLIYVLNRFLFKPVLENVRKRRERIEQARKDAMDLTKQGEDLLYDYNLKVEEAKTRANQERMSIKTGALGQADQVITQTMEKEQKILAGIRDDIAREVHLVRQNLKDEAQRLSIDVTKTVLGRELK